MLCYLQERMLNMTFGARLRQARINAKMTQKELAGKIGAKHNSISNWENDQNKPDPDTIEYICGVLNITPNYLLGASSGEKTVFHFPNIEPLPKMKKIPLLGTIACGEPILAEENFDGLVVCPDGIEADFTLRCKGDSMINARIFDGDLVFIRQQSDVDNGQIAAVLIDNEATLKRIYKQDGKLTLMAENSAYPPFIYSGQELEYVRILGKAVAFMSAVR